MVNKIYMKGLVQESAESTSNFGRFEMLSFFLNYKKIIKAL